MAYKHFGEIQISQRSELIARITDRSELFAKDTDAIFKFLVEQIAADTNGSLCGHLRLCGSIPERFDHDSTEEKQYSKYTDALLSLTFKQMGFESVVLTERADIADVDVFTSDYSFVADAKAFRLSRTAKNQKDFKVQQMDTWKHGKPFAMVVCPIHQLPAKSSQIYKQAITRSVCVFTYSHLSVILRLSEVKGTAYAERLLQSIFERIPLLHPSKNSNAYWVSINELITRSSDAALDIWREEKEAGEEALQLGKLESLTYLAEQRETYVKMDREEAIAKLLSYTKIDSKIEQIQRVSMNGILS